jgi:hypothetical protein
MLSLQTSQGPIGALVSLLEGIRAESEACAAVVATLLVSSAISECRGNPRPRHVIAAPGIGLIYVNDFVFRVSTAPPSAADLRDCESLRREGRIVEWLVPEALVETARSLIGPARRNWLTLMDVEGYLSLRVSFTSWDRRESYVATTRRIIDRYNRALRKIVEDESLRLEIDDSDSQRGALP